MGTTTAAAAITPERLARLRADFPILATTVHGRPLVYLDNAATTQKPRTVIDAERTYYESQGKPTYVIREIRQAASEPVAVR